MKMMSGYCFELAIVGASPEHAKHAINDDWDIAIYTPSGSETPILRRNIDGAPCVVFMCEDGVFRAQTAGSVGL